MNYLGVDDDRTSGGGGHQPHEEEHLQFTVEGEPGAEHQVSHLLAHGNQGEDYPVGHPVYILLGIDPCYFI